MIVYYYSGHADELGILLADDPLQLPSLRDRLDQIPADVRSPYSTPVRPVRSRAVKSGRPRRRSSWTSRRTCAATRS
jgi:hypothetical protein